MTNRETQPSGESDQPASISATSSLESFTAIGAAGANQGLNRSEVAGCESTIPVSRLPTQNLINASQPPGPQPSGGPVGIPVLVPGSQAPEFLFQLTKMLTDDNRETIEWSNGKIEVHSPHRLEEKVLHKYFRHSKFASFQRQLNYFGFRKQAGKGKMAPCSYANENLPPSTDISCLLHIKRKTSVSMSAKEKEKLAKKKEAKNSPQEPAEAAPEVNPVLAGILERSSVAKTVKGVHTAQEGPKTAHHSVAKTAVGRGIRHGYSMSRNSVLDSDSLEGPTPVGSSPDPSSSSSENPLSQLVSNYQNTLNGIVSTESLREGTDPLDHLPEDQTSYEGGFLRSDDSLVDLAMIPIVEGTEHTEAASSSSSSKKQEDTSETFCFVDFPNPELFPPPSTSSDTDIITERKQGDS